MKTLEEQINALENNITYWSFTLELNQRGRYMVEMNEHAYDYIIELQALESEVLDSLYLLLERDQKCDECVFNHFENSIQN